MSEYAHAGEWSCEACGETFDVETELDPLCHALQCGTATGSSLQQTRHAGYDRRKRELQAAMEAESA